jgi:hypothetical protein
MQKTEKKKKTIIFIAKGEKKEENRGKGFKGTVSRDF